MPATFPDKSGNREVGMNGGSVSGVANGKKRSWHLFQENKENQQGVCSKNDGAQGWGTARGPARKQPRIEEGGLQPSLLYHLIGPDSEDEDDGAGTAASTTRRRPKNTERMPFAPHRTKKFKAVWRDLYVPPEHRHLLPETIPEFVAPPAPPKTLHALRAFAEKDARADAERLVDKKKDWWQWEVMDALLQGPSYRIPPATSVDDHVDALLFVAKQPTITEVVDEVIRRRGLLKKEVGIMAGESQIHQTQNVRENKTAATQTETSKILRCNVGTQTDEQTATAEGPVGWGGLAVGNAAAPPAPAVAPSFSISSGFRASPAISATPAFPPATNGITGSIATFDQAVTATTSQVQTAAPEERTMVFGSTFPKGSPEGRPAMLPVAGPGLGMNVPTVMTAGTMTSPSTKRSRVVAFGSGVGEGEEDGMDVSEGSGREPVEGEAVHDRRVNGDDADGVDGDAVVEPPRKLQPKSSTSSQPVSSQLSSTGSVSNVSAVPSPVECMFPTPFSVPASKRVKQHGVSSLFPQPSIPAARPCIASSTEPGAQTQPQSQEQTQPQSQEQTQPQSQEEPPSQQQVEVEGAALAQRAAPTRRQPHQPPPSKQEPERPPFMPGEALTLKLSLPDNLGSIFRLSQEDAFNMAAGFDFGGGSSRTGVVRPGTGTAGKTGGSQQVQSVASSSFSHGTTPTRADLGQPSQVQSQPSPATATTSTTPQRPPPPPEPLFSNSPFAPVGQTSPIPLTWTERRRLRKAVSRVHRNK